MRAPDQLLKVFQYPCRSCRCRSSAPGASRIAEVVPGSRRGHLATVLTFHRHKASRLVPFAGGELFDHVAMRERLRESEARQVFKEVVGEGKPSESSRAGCRWAPTTANCITVSGSFRGPCDALASCVLQLRGPDFRGSVLLQGSPTAY